jgi:hypothetical protein
MTTPAAYRYDAVILTDLLNEAYHAKAWHGPTLRGSLRGVTAEQAVWRPSNGRHNIWELAVHASYWKFAVRRKILKDKSLSFGERGANWFERAVAGEAAWKADVARLDREHDALLQMVRSLESPQLSEAQTVRLIRGVALHDIYHAGQIKLLIKLHMPNR